MKSSSRIASPHLTVFNLITIKEVAATLEAIYLHREVPPLAIITVAAPVYQHLNFSEIKVVLLEMGV
jgi:hypothetical protein